MKRLIIIFMAANLLAACRDDKETVVSEPEGFEHMSSDGPAHFVYVHEDYLGDRVAQREAGKTYCHDIFRQDNYCEVYYFSKKSDVPLKFPIVNRIFPVGNYESKNGREHSEVLAPNGVKHAPTSIRVVFFKNLYRRLYHPKSQEDKDSKLSNSANVQAR